MPKPPNLTPRDIEVLDLMAAGESRLHIAIQLGVAKTSINWRVSEIRRKVGLKTRRHRELMEWLRQNGWDVKRDV